MTEAKKKRRFGFVEASRLHHSRLLPKRESDAKLEESIRRDGIQQPIIVRPSPYESNQYEIIDGHLRRKSVQDGQKVLVSVRYDVDDVKVFKISEATFKRKPKRKSFLSGPLKTKKLTVSEKIDPTEIANLHENY